MNIVRQSKYRHIRGDEAKKDKNYFSIKITKSAADSAFCAVNPKFVAIVTHAPGGGPFLVLPLEQYGRVATTPPIVDGHTSKVTELSWYPFNDNLIASASEDSKIMLWEIPDGGLKEDLKEAWQTLEGHTKKVNLLAWHPTAEYVLASGGADSDVIVWNVLDGVPLYTLGHPDLTYCLAWNYNGSLLATTCKDKVLRVYDPRQQKVVQEKPDLFTGSKAFKCAFMKDGRIFCTGFTKMSTRMYALLDAKNCDVVTSEEIDKANGIIHLHVDTDNNVVFTAGKGDNQIRYYEVNNEEPYVHFLSLYTSPLGLRGFGWLPKRGLEVPKCEIARCYRLGEDTNGNGRCDPVGMIVPRKSEHFQEDIFPPCKSDEPSLTLDEWKEGKNADPKTMSTKAMFDASKGAKGGSVRSRQARKLAVARSMKFDGGEDDLTNLMNEMKKMSATLDKVCTRLIAVEKKVGINSSEKFE